MIRLTTISIVLASLCCLPINALSAPGGLSDNKNTAWVADENTPNTITIRYVNHDWDLFIKGKVHIAKYSCNDRPSGVENLIRPIIFVEGFDVANTHSHLDHYQARNQQRLIDTLHNRGHDVVYIDWLDPFTRIQYNAYLLIEAIRLINENLKYDDELVIVGCSMGGLITRYALSYMENILEEEHNTRLFVSFDSPQQGANIPYGMQAFVKDLSDVPGVDEMWEKLTSLAAQEMLREHISDPDHSQRTTLFDSLTGPVGDYPRNLRKVAISNGSGVGVGQDAPPGAELFNLVTMIGAGGLGELTATVWAYATPPAQNKVYHGTFRTPSFPPIITHEEVYAPASQAHWDSVPGGTLNLMENTGDHIADLDYFLNTFLIPSSVNVRYTHHSFIPVVSSLDLDHGGDYHYNVANDEDIYDKTPFNKIYYPTENEEHLYISEESVEWFLSELAAIDLEICGERVEEGQVDKQLASDNITAGGDGCNYTVRGGGSSNLVAGKRVKLKPGFTAKLGSTFKAEIQQRPNDQNIELDCTHEPDTTIWGCEAITYCGSGDFSYAWSGTAHIFDPPHPTPETDYVMVNAKLNQTLELTVTDKVTGWSKSQTKTFPSVPPPDDPSPVKQR